MRLLVLIIIFSLACSISYGQGLDSLELKKMALEIEKLENELEKGAFKYWFENTSRILGLLGIIITLITGIIAIMKYNEEKQRERISFLLENLSDENHYKRLGAARGVSRYIDDVVEEVVAALSTEKDHEVSKRLENALLNISNKNKRKLIAINSSSIEERIYLAGKLKEIDEYRELAPLIVNVSKEFLKSFIKYHSITYKLGVRQQFIENKRAEVIRKKGDSGHNFLEEIRTLYNISDSTGKIIASWIADRGDYKLLSNRLDLSNCILSKIRVRKTKIQLSLYSNCNFKHTTFIDSSFSRSNLEFSDFYGSSFQRIDFIETNLNNTSFRDSKFDNVVISNSHLYQGDFSGSTIENSIFSELNIVKPVFFKGCEFTNFSLNSSSLEEAEFSGSSFSGLKITNSKIYRSKFVASEITNNSIIKDVSFNGSEFQNFNFGETKLENVDFSGSNISNADFSNAKLVNVNFNDCKGNAKF